MYEALPLTGRRILRRWTQESPQMVADLEASGQLLQAVNEAANRVADLLYDLTIVQKMDYNQAMEIAMDEWAALPSPRPR